MHRLNLAVDDACTAEDETGGIAKRGRLAPIGRRA
jgi:hypothetical protein